MCACAIYILSPSLCVLSFIVLLTRFLFVLLGLQGGRSRTFDRLTRHTSTKFPRPIHKGGRMVSVQDDTRIIIVKGVFASSPVSSVSMAALL